MSNLPAKQEPLAQLSDLWRSDGTIARLPYFMWGGSLFAIKYGLDSALAHFAFHRSWPMWGYFLPGQSLDVLTMSNTDKQFFIGMLMLALPFIWSGLVLCLRRLRSAGLPPYLVSLFFIPVVNFIMFFILCLAPGQSKGETASQSAGIFDQRQLPHRTAVVTEERLNRQEFNFALASTAPVAVLLCWFGMFALQSYGWGLFVGVPFAVGMSSSYLYGRNREKTLKQCIAVSSAAIALVGLGIFLFAWEGAICLLMAAPIVFALTYMGTSLGYNMQKRKVKRLEQNLMMIGLLFFLPTLMGAEYAANQQPPPIGVVSRLEIAAPPAVVWKNVIAFPPLPEPKEALFKLGIAYPIGATIAGTGPGAVRKCKFSTGAFVEPIKVWDEPRLLRFGVSAQPSPMRELSWNHQIQPAHLNGYLDVHAGEFHLIPIERNGRQCTLLIGTTWYQNRMWPNSYWRLFSDGIIHKIHMRVLEHIKRNAESMVCS